MLCIKSKYNGTQKTKHTKTTDPVQLASEKPADLDLQCLQSEMTYIVAQKDKVYEP